MAIAEAVKHALYISKFLRELNISDLGNVVLYNDNKGAQLLPRNAIVHPRTKHIDIKFHFIRDALRNEKLSLQYMSTDSMPADVLTKPLSRDKHYFCMSEMNVKEVGSLSA